jgi:hypothetical protein
VIQPVLTLGFGAPGLLDFVLDSLADMFSFDFPCCELDLCSGRRQGWFNSMKQWRNEYDTSRHMAGQPVMLDLGNSFG